MKDTYVLLYHFSFLFQNLSKNRCFYNLVNLCRFVCERDEVQSDSNCTIASACNDSLNRTLPNLPSCRTRNSECQEAKPEDSKSKPEIF